MSKRTIYDLIKGGLNLPKKYKIKNKKNSRDSSVG